MSKPAANPFFEADFSKMMDVSKFMDMSNMSKMFGEFKMPNMPQMPQIPMFNMEALMAVSRRNIEAMTAVNQAAFENWQSLGRRQAELFRQGIEEASTTLKAVMASETPEEKVMRQAEASKAALEKCMTNMRDIAETAAKCNALTMETVSTRMNEGMEELRGIMKTNARAA
jgi:phasin family protein